MHPRRCSLALALFFALSLGAFLKASAAAPAPSATNAVPSIAPALDAAAQALARAEWDLARKGFEALASDASAPAAVRALSLHGLAETRLAAGDPQGAEATWQKMAEDASLHRFFRQQAHRRQVEAQRVRAGQPPREPAEFREKLPTLPPPSVVLHVAPTGSDSQDGSAARPFASATRARDAIRALKKANSGQLPTGGVRVAFEPGDYAIRETLRLDEEDSGTREAPIVYQAAPEARESVRWRGGERIKTWRPVQDPAVRARFGKDIDSHVLEADLKELDRHDWGDATALRRRPELLVDGVPQTLARWPNEGFVKTGEILGTNTFKVWNTISGCKDGRFRFVEDRPLAWADEPDVRLYGYWFWDWYEEYQTVQALDVAQRTFTLAEPFSQYGYRKDQRYHAVNVLRELDQPGEWYLDRRSSRAYWFPATNTSVASAEIVLSQVQNPFIELRNTRHVILLGLELREGRGDAIRISGGADCLVAGCTIRCFGGDGIVIEGGQHHGIFGCHLETLGCGATRVAGGDRSTLEPGRHFVENCTVADISRLKRTYTPAVHLDGCGNRIAHNRFENMPSSAMRIEGNEHLIELNWVRDVVKESDDQGGVDMFGNPLYRGVVFRWNRWSDIRGGTHNGAAGIRLDDMISGVVVHGNILERCGAVIFGGVQIHGGKDNLVDGNLFLDCYAGVSFSRWGEKRWLEAISGFLPQATQPPYSLRYPELSSIRTGCDINDLSRNLYVRSGRTFLRDGGIQRSILGAVTAGPLSVESAGRTDVVRTEPTFRSLLFEPIPVHEIGPYDHPWRAGSGN